MLKKIILTFFVLFVFFGCDSFLSSSSDDSRSSEKSFTAFSFLASDNAALTSDIQSVISGTDISITVPFGTDVSDLVANYSTTGVKVTIVNTEQTSGVTHNDFSSTVGYTVTAEDGTSQNYLVTVEFSSASSEKEVTAFSFTAANNFDASLSTDVFATITGTDITCTIPESTDASQLKANFNHTGESVKISSTEQVSGTTVNDFFTPVVYTVTAVDGSTIDYTVTAEVEVPTSGLVAEYLFSGNADDTSGNGYDGTIIGGATQTEDRFSTSNSAYKFDGFDDYIDIYDTPLNDSDFNTNTASIVAWINLEQVLETDGVITTFQDNDHNDYNYIHVSYDTTNDIYKFEQGNRDNNVTDTSKLEIDSDHFGWTFIASVMNGGESKLYLDGIYINFFTLQTLSGTDLLTIGANRSIAGSSSSSTVPEAYIDGDMDDIRIYNSALTDYEIKALFHEGGWTGN